MVSPRNSVRAVRPPTSKTAVSLQTSPVQLAGKASAPAELAGYRLIGATTTKISLRRVLHLRYSDGLNLVSVFEQRRTQPGPPTLVPSGQRVVLIGKTPVHIGHRASLTTLNWDTPALRTLVQSAIQAL